ncbi:hypothetical protein BKA70DRAFT_1437771 [Coprinopsis sp. MPI-PUGE-AT-0042]|nr:hypothetical protein BKA70DRAFT_1437771 [Coprinopsis sp. MPI-PUGE-AT-0042]
MGSHSPTTSDTRGDILQLPNVVILEPSSSQDSPAWEGSSNRPSTFKKYNAVLFVTSHRPILFTTCTVTTNRMDIETFISDCSVYRKQAITEEKVAEFHDVVLNEVLRRWPVPEAPQATYEDRVLEVRKKVTVELNQGHSAHFTIYPILRWKTIFTLTEGQWEAEAKPFRIQKEIRRIQRSAQPNLNPQTAAASLVNAGRMLPELAQELIVAQNAARARRQERLENLAWIREQRKIRRDGPPPSPPSTARTRIKKRKKALPMQSGEATLATDGDDSADASSGTDTSTEVIRPKTKKVFMAEGLPLSGLSSPSVSTTTAACPSTPKASSSTHVEVVETDNSTPPIEKWRKVIRSTKKDREVIVISD